MKWNDVCTAYSAQSIDEDDWIRMEEEQSKACGELEYYRTLKEKQDKI